MAQRGHTAVARSRSRTAVARTAAARTATRTGSVTLGPVQLPDGVLMMRSPRLSDGPAWSAARRANRVWLERAFPAWGDDWESEQGEVAWTQRWWALRRAARSGLAFPFVLHLDGVLIGELGIDAVDPVRGAGEGSAWMVRDHGSAATMIAASLLLTEHVFTGPRPLDRLLSPVATTSSAGRAPGLRAVGFELEATVPRKVGGHGLVDHDIWVLHNTAAHRELQRDALRAFPRLDGPGPQPAGGDTTVVARAAAHALARTTLAAARSHGRATAPVVPVELPGPGHATVTLRGADRGELAPLPDVAATTDARVLDVGGRVVGGIGWSVDDGTATTEVVAQLLPGTDPQLLDPALREVLGAVGSTPDHLVAVRVPRGAAPATVPAPEVLAGLGLTRTASYRGNPEGPRRWAGEELWARPATAAASPAVPAR